MALFTTARTPATSPEDAPKLHKDGATQGNGLEQGRREEQLFGQHGGNTGAWTLKSLELLYPLRAQGEGGGLSGKPQRIRQRREGYLRKVFGLYGI